jgi:MinD superfamily P-loop ATPase
MLEIVVASGKGGVGKSTVSSTLGLYLARRGYHVLMADADADAPNLHLIFDMASWEGEETIYDSWIAYIDYSRCTNCGICMEECPFKAIKFTDGRYVINPVVCEGCLTCTLACPDKAIRRKKTSMGTIKWGVTKYGFKLYTSELSPGRPNSGKLVTEIKERAKKDVREDTIMITDAAAGIGCQVISSFAGADEAILVAEPTPASLSDLKRVHLVSKQFLLPAALIINKYDLNEEYTEKILEYAESEEIDVLGLIPFDPNVPISMSMMKPLIEAFPDTKATKALLEISKKVEENLVRNASEWKRRYRPKKITPYRPLIIHT